MGNLSAKVALRRAYDLDNGIYSEAVDAKVPFSLIAMHEPEAAANKGKWDELLEKYHTHQIKDYFNFTFTDWVSQPNDMVEKQINTSIRWREREVNAKSEETKELEAQLSQQGITVPNVQMMKEKGHGQ
ncbi:hypothetical protein MOA67_gp191 [Klebsiella phage KpLz-2_45]|uniref:hypothetical protein n=1 Tax=Klebsiella phage KpLz-2_45 TaxID=2698923 RepID=UPI001F13B12F|nr:hypothetical protein MOA67_gp191 [Klebsiella phage KpLz-2_45]UKS72057.1 hypothetical protein KpLz245_1910 [Klebsiella phage KpLz-2_45]